VLAAVRDRAFTGGRGVEIVGRPNYGTHVGGVLVGELAADAWLTTSISAKTKTDDEKIVVRVVRGALDAEFVRRARRSMMLRTR
jgi:hypothetical protein